MATSIVSIPNLRRTGYQNKTMFGNYYYVTLIDQYIIIGAQNLLYSHRHRKVALKQAG
jgi:hypothetical protein